MDAGTGGVMYCLSWNGSRAEPVQVCMIKTCTRVLAVPWYCFPLCVIVTRYTSKIHSDFVCSSVLVGIDQIHQSFSNQTNSSIQFIIYD
jgi:hypothetical protein